MSSVRRPHGRLLLYSSMALKSGGYVHTWTPTARKWGCQDPHRSAATAVWRSEAVPSIASCSYATASESSARHTFATHRRRFLASPAQHTRY